MTFPLQAIIPRDDPDQAVRIRRFGIAAISYCMWVLLVLYCYLNGLINIAPQVLYFIFAILALLNSALYLIFRTGFNKRFRDPSLTMPQMIMGSLFAVLITYYADSVRGVMLMVYLVVFIFGVFRLRVRQFLSLTALVLGIYGAIILYQTRTRPGEFNTVQEWLTWTVLAAVLIWFSIVGGYIYRLRSSLTKTNAELNRAMTTIEQLAILDDLTQVYNRRHIFAIMQHVKASADRSGTSFCICMLDLDHFKEVNDTLGHMAGDMVLKSTAQAMRANIRDVDFIARYGGEEFILILSSPDINDALVCVERIRQVCAELTYPDLPDSFHVTISAGVAQYQPVESLDALIFRADTALYRAKSQGRNSVSFEAVFEAVPET